MVKKLLRKKSRHFIRRQITERKNEHIQVIDQVEKILRDTRNYVISLPPEGSAVVLLVSGGLDSIITWGLLLHQYKYKVYPLFLKGNLPRSKNERKSVKFFEQYYASLFPELSQPIYELQTRLFPPEVKKALSNPLEYYHPLSLLDISVEHQGEVPLPRLPNRTIPALLPIYAQFYAHYLEDRYAVHSRCIFNGVMTGDGTVLSTQSLTSQRTAMLNLCSITNDYTWQWISLSMEPELGYWFSKYEFIKVADQLGIPLEKTWSCFTNNRHQCGTGCIACISRREEFALSGVQDKTIYQRHMLKQKVDMLKKRLQSIWNNVKKVV